MDRHPRAHRGRDRAKKKKIIESLEKAEKSKAYFSAYLRRSNCQPCDRAEAGYQIAKINKKITALNATLSIFQSIDK